MSLQTDLIFLRALNESKAISKAVNGRIYGTAIPLPDADADRVPVPYVIVTFDGMETKDEGFEGEEDTVKVGVLYAARTNDSIHALGEAIRIAIRDFFEGIAPDSDVYGLVPESYVLKGERIEYDPLKPCYYQKLNYECVTKR